MYELAAPISTLTGFLEGPVRNYFIGQSLVARGDPWPFGEHGHSIKGILDFYAILLGTKDILTIQRYLNCLRNRPIKAHQPCPCGSGKRLRDCHCSQVDELSKRIKPEYAARALRYIAAR
jgi:hypothetical protein